MNMEGRTILNLEQAALACGAAHAASLAVDQIVLDPMFRDVCKSNACGNYGKCYMCPPDAGDIYEMMERLRKYRRAVLYQTIHGIEDSFDIEGMLEAGARHVTVSQAIEKELRRQAEEYLHLSAGGCRVCDRCAKRDELPCRFPEQAMPSLEGYGVDVYNTAAHAGLRYINGVNTVTYFGMILFDPQEL